MNKKDKVENALIDKYYNESFDNDILNNDDNSFGMEMKECLKNMDAIKDMDADMNINISEIIDNAEKIKTKRKNKAEGILFIFTELSIIAALLGLSVLLGYKFLIISQIVISSVIPFTIIPISIMILKEGANNAGK